MCDTVQNLFARPRRARCLKRELKGVELEEIKAAFKLLAPEGEDTISGPEIKVAMRALGFYVKKADVVEILKEYNKDPSGSIDLSEFQEIMTNKIVHQDSTEENSKVFELFDIDGSGKITVKSLRRLAKQLGESIEDEELADMIDEFDHDGDGEINREEFFNILNGSD